MWSIKRHKDRMLKGRFVLSSFLCFGLLFNCGDALYADDNQGRDAANKALQEIRQNMSLSRGRVAELASQVDGLRKDQRTLATELVKAAKKEREASENIAASEEKLRKLLDEKAKVNESLNSRRAEFAEVLAALERMGLNPPPAILIRPDDALSSVRSAALLGSVVPEMREKTMALSDNLKELTRLGKSIANERDTMKNQVQAQAEEQKRLALLLEEKAKLQKTSEEELTRQRKTILDLTEKAKSLEDLLSELERQERQQTVGVPSDSNNLKLTRDQDFVAQKGQLLIPVAGSFVQKFGGGNNTAIGDTIATQPGAIVTAPVDAIVAYAGSFRSYGQMVILDVGQDYHILLAGMGKINVQQGQFVLSGEPLGAMGTQQIASATSLDIGKTAPMLYIEFRKQGKPVNPAPWWVVGKSGRNQNDS